MNSSILILTGPPGSGKTTLAKNLAQDEDVLSVHLHTDDFYHYIIKGRIEPFLPEAHTQNITVISVIIDAACRYAEGGYFVIVDGIIGDWFLDPFQQACKSRHIPLHYVILRPTVDTILKRAKERASGLKEETPIRELHRQFSESSTSEKNTINSSSQKIAETLDMIKEGLKEMKLFC